MREAAVVLVMTAPMMSPTMPDTLWVFNKSLLNEKIKEKIAVSGLSPKLALKKLAVNSHNRILCCRQNTQTIVAQSNTKGLSNFTLKEKLTPRIFHRTQNLFQKKQGNYEHGIQVDSSTLSGLSKMYN